MNIAIIIKVFLRTFFIESLWNFERMQNVGFVFAIMPFLKNLYKNNKYKFAERIKAHFGFFNTHPYLASLLLGITMRLEEEYSKGIMDSQEVTKTKVMLGGPLAAIGDRLIWSSWRVFCGIFVVSYFLLLGKEFPYKSNVTFALVFFLLLYNLLGHLPIRFLGIYFGYHYSRNVIQVLSKFKIQKIVEILRITGTIVLLLSSFIYSVSLDNRLFIFLFWFNMILSIFLSRKYKEILVFYLILFLNIIVFAVLK